MNKEVDSELTHSMAHYLLSIHKLKEIKGYARVTDIAKELGLTKGTVSTAVNNLKKKEFVTDEEETKFLLLTEKGHGEVHRILSANTLMFHFLKDFLGVTEEIAHRDACQLEHLLSSETHIKFFQLMKDLACTCEGSRKDLVHERVNRFNTTLDLCEYDNAKEFMDDQKAEVEA